ncbi:MAG: response regulator [Caldicoprobacterales bacterium]|jgi:two-component system chemotaxis response regulator CheY|nr:response regulator [Clostridia bacterium]MDI9513133.1 response regulator [Bacillota bacterium]NLH58260.1 response regulator [Clostridiales bacterium]
MTKRIVVADDAAFMRNIVKNILETNGYQVVGEASDGLSAVKQYKDLHPDAIIMDINMPEMDGIKATIEIKSFDEDANIIICSAISQESVVNDVIRAGAKDVIMKPFHGDSVLSVLEKVFA